LCPLSFLPDTFSGAFLDRVLSLWDHKAFAGKRRVANFQHWRGGCCATQSFNAGCDAMLGLLILLFILLTCTVGVVAGGVFLWVKYLQTPEKQWKDDISAAFARAGERCAGFSLALEIMQQQWEEERRTLTAQYFAQQLAAIPVEALANFPGIGPATVDRLQSAGCTNLDQLRHAHLGNITGLGDKRLADIDHAQHTLINQARQNWDAGACSEVKALVATLAERQRGVDEQEQRTQLRLQAANQIRNNLERLTDEAAVVTFFAFVWNRGERLLPDALIQTPVPDLESAIDNAAKAYQRPHSADPASFAVIVSEEDVIEEHVGAVAHPVEKATPQWVGGQSMPPIRVQNSKPVVAAMPISVPPALPPSVDLVQRIMELTVQFAFVVARCDGHVAKKEKDWIANHISQRYRHDPVLLNRARALCAHYETAAVNVDACFDEINARLTTGHKGALVKLAYDVAAAAGEITQKETKFLHKLCQRLNVAIPQYPAPAAAPGAKQQVVVRSPSVVNAPAAAAAPKTGEPATGAKPQAPLDVGAKTVQTSTADLVKAAASPKPIPAVPASGLLSTSPGVPVEKPSSVRPVGKALTSSLPQPPSRQQLLAWLEIDLQTPLSPDLIRRHYTRLVEKFAPEKMQNMGPEFVAVAQQKRQQIEQAARTLIAPWKEELVVPVGSPTAQDLRHNPDLDALFGA
jgi:tellurite resistance protein